MFRSNRSGFTLVELMVVIAILGLLVSVLAFAVGRHYIKAQADLEKVQLKDLANGLNQSLIDRRHNATLRAADRKDHAGRAFWQDCFQYGLLDGSLRKCLVSQHSGDVIAPEGTTIEAENCSYTGPRLGELRDIMSARGSKRRVMMTHNTRNWNNYESIGYGAVVMWSDSEVADYMNAEQAEAEHGITAEEWAAPADNLYGRKAPFDRTFE